MKGYVTRKGDRWYAVIYEELDPVTAKERRTWHAAGTDREDAEKLAADRNRLAEDAGSLTFGAFLTERWLPGKRYAFGGYHLERLLQQDQMPRPPHPGEDVPIRRLKASHLEGLYEKLLHPSGGGKPLAPKSVLDVHQIIRSALSEAQRLGIVSRNVALHAHAPRSRGVPKPEHQVWNADELQTFLRAAAAHRLFPVFWLMANTGMRRNQVLGLQWDDIDGEAGTVSINRGEVDVGYEVQQTRGKSRSSRRLVTLDETTLELLGSWRAWRIAEAVGVEASEWVFADHKGEPVHPQSLSQAFERIINRADVPVIRLHDLRHTHATLLIKEGVPVKVVSERLGHASPAFTMTTYQHVLPGCRPKLPQHSNSSSDEKERRS